MIREIIKEPLGKYGRYFLSMEAPGDAKEVPIDDGDDAEEIPVDDGEDAEEVPVEDTDNADEVPVDDGEDAAEVPMEEPPKRSNKKVIDVKPNNRARLDFTDGADDVDDILDGEDAAEVPADDTDNVDDATEVPVDDGEDAAEVPADDTNNVDDATEVPQDSPVDQLAGNNTADNGDDATEVTTDVDNPEQAGDDATEVDTGDSEDFTGDAAEETPPDGEAQAAEDQKKGPGLEYDSTRKYTLFLNFQSLVNSIDNYITKLEKNMNDDPNENYVIKISLDKLRVIKELATDYMMMKFEISTYIQSLLFFQNIVVMVQMIFDMLSKMQKKQKIKNDKIKH